MRELRGARGAEQTRLLQAQHFSRLNLGGRQGRQAGHHLQLRPLAHPAVGGLVGKG